MDFQFSDDDEKFRHQVCDWLTEQVTPDFELELERRHDEKGFLQAFSRKLSAKGWLTLAWPKEYGGQGGSFIEQAIFHEELGYHQAPELAHTVGVNMVGPALMIHGTEDQKKKFLPPIARMENVYAQGFTEPDAGSDVAALKTRAVEDGDQFVVNGHKIFMGNAHISDIIYLAARTDPSSERHRGISLFIVPLDTPGIEVKGIPTVDGHQVNAVFFDDVVVPRDWLVGEKNRGWYAMVTTLDFERSGIGGAAGAKRHLEDLLAFSRVTQRQGVRLIDDPWLRHRFAEMALEIEVWRTVCWRIVAMQMANMVPNIESAMTSIIGKTFVPKLGALVLDVLGPYATLPPEEERWAPMQGRLQRLVTRSILTHPGGTPEILKNILATRGLGLPRG